MKEKNYNRSWNIIKYVVAIFNFLAALSSIIGLIYTFYNDGIKYIWLISLLIFLICLIAFIIAIHSEKVDNIKRETMYAKSLHEILHILRDDKKELDNLIERADPINKEDFIQMITKDSIEIMNKLSAILSSLTGVKVRSCIKLFDFIKDNEKDSNNMNLITFARSGSDGYNSARNEQMQTIKVSDNTDFNFIFSIKEVYEENRVHYFYQKDLNKYSKKYAYKNSTRKWFEKYKTTIVLPMRYLKESTAEKAVYDIVGFLCVDANVAGAFEKNNINFIIEFLKGISDIMYSYLNSCIIYYKQL